jgi:bloom syndrome protein
MNGRSRVHLQVQVSGANAVAKRKAPKSAPKKQSQPSSTMLTSPIPQSRSTKKGKNRYVEDDDDDLIDEEFHPSTYAQDDFPAFDDLEESDDDAFEPMAATRTRRDRQDHELGPPIIANDGMQNLNAIHGLAVEDFVEEARRLEENIRNRKGHRKPYFTVLEFRNMAIHWTTDLEKMSRIRAINSDNVDNFGHYFIDLIKKHKARYEQMMDPRHKTDMNHQTVIDLVSDNEGSAIEDDEDEEEDDGYQSEAPSKYFVPPDVQAFNEVMNKASKSTKSQTTQPESSKKSSRRTSGGGFRARGRGGSKDPRRRSSGGTSNSSRSRPGAGGAGVTKKKTTTGGRKTSGHSTASKQSSVMGQFGRSGGGGGGGGGNFGIAPMPT